VSGGGIPILKKGIPEMINPGKEKPSGQTANGSIPEGSVY
jgi:hypothetical protein